MRGEMCAETLPTRMVQTLAQAIAVHVGRAPGRLPRVVGYARGIGLCLGWDEARLLVLEVASLLHDAGELVAPQWAVALARDGRPGPAYLLVGHDRPRWKPTCHRHRRALG